MYLSDLSELKFEILNYFFNQTRLKIFQLFFNIRRLQSKPNSLKAKAKEEIQQERESDRSYLRGDSS